MHEIMGLLAVSKSSACMYRFSSPCPCPILFSIIFCWLCSPRLSCTYIIFEMVAVAAFVFRTPQTPVLSSVGLYLLIPSSSERKRERVRRRRRRRKEEGREGNGDRREEREADSPSRKAEVTMVGLPHPEIGGQLGGSGSRCPGLG